MNVYIYTYLTEKSPSYKKYCAIKLGNKPFGVYSEDKNIIK